jgi:hypothetical protein
MKIKSIKNVVKKRVFDLSVEEVEHYILENGVVTHNTGIYYSADNIWILGRRQNKTGQEVTGYDFIINVEKSRYVKEKSKIPISVSWDGGIERFSGLLDVALASGHVVKPSNGWYQKVDTNTGEVIGNKVREKDTLSEEFWQDILNNEAFVDFIEKQYCIGNPNQVDLDQILEMES